MEKRTRRGFLRNVSVASVPCIAGCSTISSTEPEATSADSSPTESADGNRTEGLERRIDELEDRNRELEARLENETVTVADLESKLERKSDEITDLKAELEAERERISDLRSRLDEKDERLESLERELENREDRIAELEDRLDEGGSEFAAATMETVRDTALETRKSVVFVHTGGTGWVLDAAEGYVVTNAHVVANTPAVEVTTFDGTTLEAERIGYVEGQHPDVALLQCDLEGVPSLGTGSSESLARDDPVFQIGHPIGPGRWIISLGRYRRRDRAFGLLSIIPSQSGNSGSPLMTPDGSVVGLTTGGTNNGEVDYSRSETVYTEFPDDATLATSVPIETVLERVDEWRS